jgi:hypothetical protein
MNKTIALAWGAASVLPFAFMLFFMTSIMIEPSTDDFEEHSAQFDFVFQIGMWANASIFALLISYIVYLFKTDHVPKDKKALWAVVLFMGHVLAMPIFWYIYVWSPLSHDRSSDEQAS